MPPNVSLASPNTPWPLRDRVAFVGIGTTRFENLPDTDSYGLGCEALNAALDDAGLTVDEVDGLVVNRIPSCERFAEMMGINPQYCLLTEAPGRFSGVSPALQPRRRETTMFYAASGVSLRSGTRGRSTLEPALHRRKWCPRLKAR